MNSIESIALAGPIGIKEGQAFFHAARRLKDIAPLLGGRAAADRFIAMSEELDTNATFAPQRLAAMQ